MRKLTLHKKTGFRVIEINKPIIIRDFRFILFYTTEYLLPRCKQFNLPAGDYWVDSGNFKAMDFPIKYRLANLPAKVRNYAKPTDFKIQFAPNPSKCTIFWDLKKIVFDSSFKDMPLPVIDFVRLHEFGHSYYGTTNPYASYKEKQYYEKCADKWAGNAMLVKGYNPSQIGEAPIVSLSDAQIDRMYLMKETVKNYYETY